MVTATNELISIGQLCQVCQALPRRITEAADRIGEQPALKLDSVAYYGIESAEKIAAAIKGKQS